MRVIITGGTGLIGKALAKDLLKDQNEIVILSRNPDKYRNQFPGQVRIVAWDAKTTAGWGELVDGADAVVNLAGENLAGEGFFPKRWTNQRRRIITDSRVNAGRAIVAAVKSARKKPAVVIQASAVGYYGPLGDEEVSEDHSPAADFAARVCIDWENSSAPVEEFGVRRAIIRTGGIVLSKDGGALPRLMLPMRLFAGGPFGNGRQWYTWIHPADHIAAIRFLIEEPTASGAFNLTSPKPLRNKDFNKALGRAMNRPSWLPVPGFVLRLLFGEVANVVLTGQRVLPTRLQEMGFNFQYPEAEAAFLDILEK